MRAAERVAIAALAVLGQVVVAALAMLGIALIYGALARLIGIDVGW